MTVYFPGLLFYTEKLPAGCGGCANGPIIRIRPRYRNDKGLHEHEAEHVRQWWRTLGLHSLLYLVSRKYRLWAEVAAYRVQLQNPPAKDTGEQIGCYVELYSTALADKYGLDITAAAARARLMEV